MSENLSRISAQDYLIESAHERLQRCGVASMSDVELLALVLRGAGQRAVHATATRLLAGFGSLRKLLTAGHGDAQLHPRIHVVLQAAIELTRRHYGELMQTGTALSNPRATREYLRMRLRDLEHEVFCCIYLDNRFRVIAFAELFRGTTAGASVHPREVVKEALAHNAAAVILAHNHPSGIAEPSQADELITRRLKE